MKHKPTSNGLDRRRFLQRASLAGAGLAAHSFLPFSISAQGANEKIVVGVMGLGRGRAHVNSALELPNVEVGYVCDVDQQRIPSAVQAVEAKQPGKVKGVEDFRVILDDPDIDALFIATCNHWHAPATIMACNAGKHVYVEKPGSHNPWEGEMMVRAAREHKRVVQMGNQRRSWPGIIEAIEQLRAGAIGRLTFSRCWYNNLRPSIGRGKVVPVPPSLDFSLWQGPAPLRPYKDNLVHYNWHWHWHWGNGELGNNGIHALDLSRWGLNVEYPLTVGYVGGRYHFDDDQETPDSGVAAFDFGGCGASWSHGSCHPRRHENLPFVSFYGTEGALEIEGGGYRIFDLAGKEVAKGSGPGGDLVHAKNFIDCIRSGEKPNSEIEEGQKSTLLCHLGNIAYRTRRGLRFDPETREIVDQPEAQELWKREYRPGWEPKIT